MNRLIKEAHIVEDINGIRCSVVEKNAPPERVEFLKRLLEHNGFEVQVQQTPPPKAAPPKSAPPASPDQPAPPPPLPPVAPNTFTIGVTDILFHPMLAVYERSLKTFDGRPVFPAYWNQEGEREKEWYWKRRGR